MEIVAPLSRPKQLANILEDEIRNGKLPPDSRLCSIRTLKQKFSVDTKIISTDNLEMESVLPAPVARIWFDNKELGEAAMNSMAALLDDRLGANSVTLIRPKFVE